jgi:hypothetical protein
MIGHGSQLMQSVFVVARQTETREGYQASTGRLSRCVASAEKHLRQLPGASGP